MRLNYRWYWCSFLHIFGGPIETAADTIFISRYRCNNWIRVLVHIPHKNRVRALICAYCTYLILVISRAQPVGSNPPCFDLNIHTDQRPSLTSSLHSNSRLGKLVRTQVVHVHNFIYVDLYMWMDESCGLLTCMHSKRPAKRKTIWDSIDFPQPRPPQDILGETAFDTYVSKNTRGQTLGLRVSSKALWAWHWGQRWWGVPFWLSGLRFWLYSFCLFIWKAEITVEV